MVKFCCGQICSRMRLSLFPLKSPVFPGSHIGISVPQMCKNQQFSSWHGRLSSAVPLGQQQGLASILPPHPVSPPHLCAQSQPDPFMEPPLPSALPFCASWNPHFHLHPPGSSPKCLPVLPTPPCCTFPFSVLHFPLVLLRSLNCMCFYCLFPCFCYGCRTSLSMVAPDR